MRPIAFAVLVTMPGVAAAQVADSGRFQLERTENGIVRLDTRTGAMSLCQDRDGNLICRMAADERAAYEEQLDRLEKRVKALEDKAGATGLSSSGENLPSDAEVNRSIGIMERFMRAFFGLVREFEAEDRAESSPPPRTN
ncbi:hypothetical protein J5J09_03840 [Ciceribacter sp. L1K22]|nr:hypothetical protein [Ciceribacter sp. L1K22]